MKKIVYSGVLKFLAVLLLIACMVLGVLAAAHGAVGYCSEEVDLYSLENDFSESWYISALLNEPENIVYHAYRPLFREWDDEKLTSDGTDRSEETDLYGEAVTWDVRERSEADLLAVEERLHRLLAAYQPDSVDYYIRWNDTVWTNCGAESADELAQGACFSYVKREPEEDFERRFTGRDAALLVEDIAGRDGTSTIVIASRVREESVASYKAIWERQERAVREAVVRTFVCAVSALLLFIYLLAVCGKSKDGTYKNLWLDNV
jgi:hypothetical protein